MIAIEQLTPEAVEVLREAIVRQACLDYYRDCVPPEKNPPVPRIEVCDKKGKYLRDKNGKIIRKLMPEWQYKEYLERREVQRKGRKQEELRFFHSDWYKQLCGIDAKALIAQIEYKRKRGIPLFTDEDESK